MDEEEETFDLIDESVNTKNNGDAKIIVAYQDSTIKELREEIQRLNKKIDRVHWFNTVTRIGYIVFNPSFHLQNVSKDFLYRGAYHIIKQFLS